MVMEFGKRKRSSRGTQQQESQESRATSTPRHTPARSLSFSVSTIEFEDQKNEDPLFEFNESEYSATETADYDPTADSLQETDISEVQELKPLKWTGFWYSLKPKRKNSLFYKIMTQPGDIVMIIEDLLFTYHENKHRAILSILQLFVDLCGYKNVSLVSIYNFESKEPGVEIIKQLETALAEPDTKRGKFMFLKYSNFVKWAEHVLETFLNQLVIIFHIRTIVQDEFFASHILHFVDSMSFSSLRCIRVTGVILASKLITAFSNLYSAVTEPDKNRNTSLTSPTQNLIENYLGRLHTMYNKNCLLPEKKSFVMKIICAQDMYNWMCLFPDVFITKHKCLGRLLGLIKDPNAAVRLAALRTCKKLICLATMQHYIHERIDLCLTIVSNRLLDVDFNVATESVRVFTEALERYPNSVSKNHKLYIFYRMYERNLELSKTACKFLANYLDGVSADEQSLLISFTKIAFLKQGFGERLPFLIEACMEFIPQLKNWDAFVVILLNDRLGFNFRTQVIEVLYEAVRFLLTGKCSKSRGVTTLTSTEPTRYDHESVVNNIIPNFENLMVAFQTNETCMKRLLEVLTFINYNVCRKGIWQTHLNSVLSVLHDLFFANSDRDVLETIVEALNKFCEENEHAVGRLKSITKNIVKTLVNDLKEVSHRSDNNFIHDVQKKSLRASVLFGKFNLTPILKWIDIFHVLDVELFKVVKYLLICCKWHLVWDLRKIVVQSNSVEINLLFYNNCKEFVYHCINLLKQLEVSSELFLVYETFTDLYIRFDKELTRKRQFSKVIIQITEPKDVEVVFNFVQRYVVEDEAHLSLEQRQDYFNKIVSVLCVGGFPTECFSKILCFYHSHYEVFGNTMDFVLKQLANAHPALTCVIIQTLSEIYNKILAKQQTVNILSTEVKQLKLLTKKFATIKNLVSKSDVLKLVNMSLYFGLREEKNYPFLYCVRNFLKILDDSGRNEAYEVFRSRVPLKAKSNDILLTFAAELKPST